MTDARQEDTTRRKRFKKLIVREGSVVPAGGNQHAHIMLFRHDEETTPMPEPTFTEKLLSLFRKSESVDRAGFKVMKKGGKFLVMSADGSKVMGTHADEGAAKKQLAGMLAGGDKSAGEKPAFVKRMPDSDDAPMSPKEILQGREMKEKMFRAEGAFFSSMQRILSMTKGTEQIGMMRKAVDEFGSLMDDAIGKADVKRLLPAVQAIASALADDDNAEGLTSESVESLTRTFDELLPDGPAQQEKKMDIKNILESLEPEQAEVIKRELESAKAPATPETPEETLQTVARGLDDSSKAVLEEVLRSNKEKDESITRLNDRLDAMDKNAETVSLRRTAARFSGLGKTEDEVIETLRDAKKAGIEDSVISMLEAASQQAQVAAEVLFREAGSAQGVTPAGSAMEEVNRLVDAAIEKNPDLTPLLARNAVWEKRHDLRDRVAAEDKARFNA